MQRMDELSVAESAICWRLSRTRRLACSIRITSYNVCYTKLLREKVPVDFCYRPQDDPRAKDNNCDGKLDNTDPVV